MADGGQVAAYGFRYQYLAAAEQILIYLLDHAAEIDSISLTIEPARFDNVQHGDTSPDEVIDYIINHHEVAVIRTQVKASRQPSTSRPLQPRIVTKILARMGPGAPGEGLPQILTNRPPSKRLRDQCGTPLTATKAQVTYEVKAGQGPIGVVVHDQRSIADVKAPCCNRSARRGADSAQGLGEKSADLLMSVLLDQIFDAAAGMSANTISGVAILHLLGAPDAELAHALRGYDWGAPLLEVPRLVSAVPRIETLAELSVAFNDSMSGRNPAVAILSGVTGFGKSTIAADFCHLNRHQYEFIVWIDCREESLIEAKARDTLARMGVLVEPESDIAALFRTEMGALSGPFVVVFDGAATRHQIERFAPTSGCGLTIVTTTSNAKWWASERRILVEGFTTQEAIRCFASYADIDIDLHRTVVEDVVKRLQKVPLAIAMAGLYFHDSGGDVARLSASYFETLAALDVRANIPEGFDHTAFAAVEMAVDRLRQSSAGGDGDRQRAQDVIGRTAMLGPELIPFSLVLQAVSGVSHDDPTQPPRPAEFDAHTRNVVMATLQTQTIARRRQYVDTTGNQNPASDTINIHPLVHEILQNLLLRADPAELVGPATDLMACMYGWLEQMRNDGAFFPVDQLLVHSDALLAVVNTLEFSSVDADYQFEMRRAQALLKHESASAYSSRGQHGRSVSLIESLLRDTRDVPLSPLMRAMVAKAAANAITDLYSGGLDASRALPLAERLVEELQLLESSDHPHSGEWVRLSAGLGAQALRALGNDGAGGLLNALDEIADRQMRRPSITGAVQRITADIKAGRLVESLAQIARVAAWPSAQSPQSKATLQQLSATSLLHLGGYGDAADGYPADLVRRPLPPLGGAL